MNCTALTNPLRTNTWLYDTRNSLKLLKIFLIHRLDGKKVWNLRGQRLRKPGAEEIKGPSAVRHLRAWPVADLVRFGGSRDGRDSLGWAQLVTHSETPPAGGPGAVGWERERPACRWEGSDETLKVLRALNCLEETKNIN